MIKSKPSSLIVRSLALALALNGASAAFQLSQACAQSVQVTQHSGNPYVNQSDACSNAIEVAITFAKLTARTQNIVIVNSACPSCNHQSAEGTAQESTGAWVCVGRVEWHG